MVDIKLLEEVIPDIDLWSYGNLKDIKLLSEEEIRGLTSNDLGSWCDSNKLSLCITALHHMRKKTIRTEELFNLKRDIQKAPLQPLEKVITHETTGVDKCPHVTC